MINNKDDIKKSKLDLNYDDYENNFFNSTKLENVFKHILINIKNLNFGDTNHFYDAVLKIPR